MKKLALILALALAFTCVLTACGKKEDPAASTTDIEPEILPATGTDLPEEPTPAEEPIANMTNPVEEVGETDIDGRLGIKLNTPEDAEDAKYFIIGNECGEIQFTVNGAKLNARAKPATEFTDISGMNYEFEGSEDITVSGIAGKKLTHKGEGEEIAVVLWYDVAPGVMYSLSAQGETLPAELDLVELAAKVYVPLQGNAG